MLVLLNPRAHGGSALERWEALLPLLERERLIRDYHLLTEKHDVARRLVIDPDQMIVAAGGDGTVNSVIDAVMELPADLRRHVTIGAVGLGSSNDFHKPVGRRRVVNGIPLRLDVARSCIQAVARVELDDGSGGRRTRYFVLNASIGIIASGNHLFNAGGPFIRGLKRWCVPAAIWYATIRSVVAATGLRAQMTIAGQRLDLRLTSASFLLSPYFTGTLRYDVGMLPEVDALPVAICDRMGLPSRVRMLRALSQGRFSGSPGTRVLWASRLEVELERPCPFELDGEVTLAQRFRVVLLPKAVNLCS
jgi:diacylglycerol kinase (ATP)